jgi:tellurite resistance protein TerC
MILLGIKFIEKFSGMMIPISLFLIYTGIKIRHPKQTFYELDHSRFYQFLCRHLRILPKTDGNRFFVQFQDPQTGQTQWGCTPLLPALLWIEFLDFVFALDSVPAILALTTDPFVVYTSNIFALLGLRALYSLLAEGVHRFLYLKPALGLILIFIGTKTFVVHIFGWEEFPITLSLAVIFGLLAGGIGLSLRKAQRRPI